MPSRGWWRRAAVNDRRPREPLRKPLAEAGFSRFRRHHRLLQNGDVTIPLRNDRRAGARGEGERHAARHQSVGNRKHRAAAERDIKQTEVDLPCRSQQGEGSVDRRGRSDDLRTPQFEQPGQRFRHHMIILDQQDAAPLQIRILHSPPPLRALQGSWSPSSVPRSARTRAAFPHRAGTAATPRSRSDQNLCGADRPSRYASQCRSHATRAPDADLRQGPSPASLRRACLRAPRARHACGLAAADGPGGAFGMKVFAHRGSWVTSRVVV